MKIIKGLTFIVVSFLVLISIVLGVALIRYTICHDKPIEDERLMIKVESGESTYSNYDIYYDKETKVMYMVEYRGGIIVLVNPDGTPKLYKGGSNE